MLSPNQHKDAIKQIAWPTVLLVAGVSTYAAILTEAHSPEFVGKWAAGLGAVVIGALMLANRPDTITEPVYYQQILTCSMIVVVAGPLLVWAALVAPGWSS